MPVEEDRPIRDAPRGAKRPFARAEVAEPVEERAGHDDDRRRWVHEHTGEGRWPKYASQ